MSVFILQGVKRWERQKGLTTTTRCVTGLGKEITAPVPGVAGKAEDVSGDVSRGWGLWESFVYFSRHVEKEKKCRGSTLMAHGRAALPASWERWRSRANQACFPPELESTRKSSAKAWQRNFALLTGLWEVVQAGGFLTFRKLNFNLSVFWYSINSIEYLLVTW